VAAASEEWGERPVAFLLVEDDAVDLDRVRAQLAEQVPRWWLPDDLIVLDELPKTSVGKHDKRALRTQLYKQ
jgi:fatty-acyl-CoA synthase